MANLFLTGGKNGMWKRKKLSTIAPFYIDVDATVSVVEGVETIEATTSSDFDMAMNTLKDGGIVIARINLEGITSKMRVVSLGYDPVQETIVFVAPKYSLDHNNTNYSNLAAYWFSDGHIVVKTY